MKPKNEFYICDIYVNKNFIVKFKEDLKMLEMLISGRLPRGFPQEQKFTLITLSSGNINEDMSIIGSLEYVYRKLEE